MSPAEIPVDETLRVVQALARHYAALSPVAREELVGEGVLAAVRHADRFKIGRSSWTTWCHRVAAARMREVVTSAVRERARLSTESVRPVQGDLSDPGPFVAKALRNLTPRQAEILTLVLALDGGEPRTSWAVAGILGLGRGNIETSVRRSLDKLRRHLSEGDAA